MTSTISHNAVNSTAMNDDHRDAEEQRRRRQQRVPFLDLEKLKVISPLGRGAKGVVFLVQSEENGEIFALKCILKASLDKKTGKAERSGYRRIFLERDVLASFQHPLFPKLHGLLSSEKLIGYAIDYCPGRDLNTLRKNQTEKTFSDDIIRFYAAELVLAMEYLHGLGIVYRDLKPENVMIKANGHLMLVDFDLSTRLSPKTPERRRSPENSKSLEKKKTNKKRILPRFFAFCSAKKETVLVHPYETDSSASTTGGESDSAVEKSNSFVGTEEYVAPEVISGSGHDFSLDYWCLGVMLHEMLYGTTPFRGENRKETFYRILTKNPELVGEPTPLRDLIRKLLEKDPQKRITLEEIKGHDFFKSVDWDRILDLSRPPFIPVPEEIGGECKEIDVESFVQGVFNVKEEDEAEKVDGGHKNMGGKKNDGVWVQDTKYCELLHHQINYGMIAEKIWNDLDTKVSKLNILHWWIHAYTV